MHVDSETLRNGTNSISNFRMHQASFVEPTKRRVLPTYESIRKCYRMNQIEWRANNSKQLIAFENSKPLSDFDRPKLQAQSWVNSLELDPETEALCMVGCGSGFQIEALIKAYPQIKLYVVESRPALIGFFAKKYKAVEFIFVEKIENLKSLENLEFLMTAKVEKVLFKPAIGYQADILEEVYWFLNLRTFEALSFHLKKKIEGSAQALISAKQFIQHVDKNYPHYKASEILTVKEMIK